MDYRNKKSAPEAVLKEIEIQAEREFLPIIGPSKGKVLVDHIKKNHPEKILEIGTNIGYSSILMASSLSDVDIPRIITIEIDKKTADRARNNISKCGLENKIEVVVGPALKIIPKVKGPFDLLFIDAVKKDYLNYLKESEEKLNKDAFVIADNVKMFAREVSDYLDYVRQSKKFKSSTFNFGSDAVEVSRKI